MTTRRRLGRAGSLTRYELASGESNAAILNEMLDNPAADRSLSETAIQRAIADGMSPAMAVRLYGLN